ncbi:DUF2806 domain-containing protein [Brachyspira intermedia]|uniref:DUF2806 domain-containing protein n=1 Tax=Brachyspira intermedia TaxID=84377 RepID=UPI00300588E3
MNINLNIDCEPIKKLIETIRLGIGEWFKPWHMKRIVDAKSYEIKKISEVISKNNTINIDYNNDGIIMSNSYLLMEDTKNRLINEELLKTSNIENVINKTYGILKDEKNVSDKPVDKDWATRFFYIVKNISNEDIQYLWAKLLSEEIKQPNSFSYRTLELLKNMTTDEAKLFEKAAKLLFYTIDNNTVLFSDMELLNKYGINYNDIITLVDIGIINSLSESVLTMSNNELAISNNDYFFSVKLPNKQSSFGISIFSVSKVGNDILKLIDDKCNNNNYFKDNIDKIIKYNNITSFIFYQKKHLLHK